MDEDVYYMKLQRLENVFKLFLHKDSNEAVSPHIKHMHLISLLRRDSI